MGLTISNIAMLPENVTKNYYLYILDYYNWNEPIANTLRANFGTIAKFVSENNSVVLQAIEHSEFNTQLMSWRSINGLESNTVLPALMITTLPPKYFFEAKVDPYFHEGIRYFHEGIKTPKDKFIFIKIGEICKSPQDVITLLGKIFTDIQNKKQIKDFSIQKEIKGGSGKIINDSLILQPNFGGIGIDLKQLFDFFRK